MAQNIEYPLWTPHERARLYRRYKGEVDINLNESDVITIEDNRYVSSCKFKWVETTSKESGDDQSIGGLVVETEYITIRTNSLEPFKKGDLVMLPESCKLAGLWIIEDGVRTDYAYTPKAIQTYQYLPLKRTG